ncbi:MAG: F0F1 ATP synthase subunit B [Gemmatimonadetes bacterium]|nr:F0F1 ATP synthase subunit B [Gemmatimonadota bacterium]
MRATRILPVALSLLAALPGPLWAQGAGEESGGGLFDINTGLSVWTLIIFAGLLLILSKTAWGPILAAVDAREKGIQAALDEAAQRNAEAAGLLEQHREQLMDARRQANELIAEGKAAGENVRKDIEEKARSEGKTIVERARAEIGRERDAALDMLRKESVELALAAASQLMRERLDQAKDREFVERYLDELGDSRGAQA